MQNGTIFCKQYLESMDSKPDFRMIEQANSVCMIIKLNRNQNMIFEISNLWTKNICSAKDFHVQ